jgi:hypothetical protein
MTAILLSTCHNQGFVGVDLIQVIGEAVIKGVFNFRTIKSFTPTDNVYLARAFSFADLKFRRFGKFS